MATELPRLLMDAARRDALTDEDRHNIGRAIVVIQQAAALAAPPVEQPSIEDLCARIKAADDAAADGDYMLDSDDCISVLRGTWKGPLAMDKPNQPAPPVEQQARELTYSSTQATECAGCGVRKHTPLRIDAMGGYVCLTCISNKLGSMLGEFGHAEPEQPAPQALSAPDSERAARAKAMTAAQVAKLLRWEAVCAHRMNVWQLDRAAELLEAQPAPQAGAAEPALRPDIQAVLLELDVPVQGYLASHAGTFLKHAAMMPPEEYPIPLVRESDHRRACRKIAALATHPTEQPSQDATEEFVGYLCCAWGESDLPVAELVRDLESVGSFMVSQWLGADDAQDYDGTPTLPRLMTEWQDHDWDNEWSADFEIGGVSVERLHCTIPAARAAQAQGEKGKA